MSMSKGERNNNRNRTSNWNATQSRHEHHTYGQAACPTWDLCGSSCKSRNTKNTDTKKHIDIHVLDNCIYPSPRTPPTCRLYICRPHAALQPPTCRASVVLPPPTCHHAAHLLLVTEAKLQRHARMTPRTFNVSVFESESRCQAIWILGHGKNRRCKILAQRMIESNGKRKDGKKNWHLNYMIGEVFLGRSRQH